RLHRTHPPPRPAPPPPPFPYTTLFRSQAPGLSPQSVPCGTPERREAHTEGETIMALERIQKIMSEQGLCSRRAAEQIIAEGRVKDRKSTRLNSSHVSMSYAVFCLKKKR